MRRVLLSGTIALALTTALPLSPAHADTTMSRQDVTQQLATSSGGAFMPLFITALLIAALLAGNGGGGMRPYP